MSVWFVVPSVTWNHVMKAQVSSPCLLLPVLRAACPRVFFASCCDPSSREKASPSTPGCPRCHFVRVLLLYIVIPVDDDAQGGVEAESPPNPNVRV